MAYEPRHMGEASRAKAPGRSRRGATAPGPRLAPRHVHASAHWRADASSDGSAHRRADAPSAGAMAAPASAPAHRHAAKSAPAATAGFVSAPDVQEQVGRSAALMSALVIVSRATGFVRTFAKSFALGSTVIASCYNVADNLPALLLELVMGGMLVTAFLPVYLSVKERAGREGANAYASNLVTIVLVLMGSATALSLVFASQVIFTQSFTARAEFDAPLATWFFRFFAIEIVLYALSSLFSGVLNAERDYLWSNVGPIFNNLVTIASFVAYALLAGSSPQLALVVVALGNPLGVAVQTFVQLPSLRRHGVRLRLRIDLHDPALRETLSIGIPTIVIAACSFVTVSVQNNAALSVTEIGAVAVVTARQWYTMPYGILAVPITTALFTELSRSYAAGDMRSYRSGVTRGTCQLLFFLVPFMLYLIVFAEPLVMVLAARRFSDEAIAYCVTYLWGLAVGLPAYGVCMYLQKVCSSLRRMVLYTVANVVGSAAQVAICLWVTPLLGIIAPAVSSAVFYLAVDVVTFASLRRQLDGVGLGRMLLAGLRSLALGFAGAAVGAGVLAVLPGLVGPLTGSVARALLYVTAGGIPAVIITYGLALLLRVPEASVVRSLAGRVLHRGA